MLHKKAILDDWLQIIFAIVFISFTFILFVGIKKGVEAKLENQADAYLENIEDTKILLNFIAASHEGKKHIDTIAHGLGSREYEGIEKIAYAYFVERYTADVTWSLDFSGPASYKVQGPGFAAAAKKREIDSVMIALPENEVLTIKLSVGEQIHETLFTGAP